jgi:hypothetical protein
MFAKSAGDAYSDIVIGMSIATNNVIWENFVEESNITNTLVYILLFGLLYTVIKKVDMYMRDFARTMSGKSWKWFGPTIVILRSAWSVLLRLARIMIGISSVQLTVTLSVHTHGALNLFALTTMTVVLTMTFLTYKGLIPLEQPAAS